MGWNPFKSKKVTTVGTSISRLIPDKDLVDSTKAAVVTALFNKTDLVDEVLESNLNGLSVRTERMYQYAKKSSPFGLPTGEIYANTQGKAELQSVLDTLEGKPVLIEYHRFGSPNAIHMGWMNLIEYHGYDPQTNKLGILSAQKGTPVYLADMFLEAPAWMANEYDREEVAIWGKAPTAGYTPDRQLVTGSDYSEIYYNATPAVFTQGILNPQLKVSFVWEQMVEYQDPDSNWYSQRKSYVRQSVYSSFSMPYRDVDTDSGYFHVKYVVDGVTKYWMYKYGSGEYPELDGVFVDSPNVLGDYFPNIYFRLNKQNLAADNNSSIHKFNTKMMKYLGASFADVSEAIHANPDIGDVEQAFLTLGVPVDSQDPLDLEYLYEYFDSLYAVTDTQIRGSSDNFNDVVGALTRSFSRFLKGNTGLPLSQTIAIRDGAFSMDLSNSGILKTRGIGKIGKVGTVSYGTGQWTYQTKVQEEYGSKAITSTITHKVPYRYYRKQIADNFFDEIQVVNAQMKYWIYGGHNTVLGDDGGEILLIPIDRGILKKFNARDTERLVSRSLHFVFNSRVVTKLKWYQQEWFGIFLVIVAVIITVVTWGADGGSSLTAAAATLAGMTAIQIIIALAYKIIIYLAVRESFKLFVKAVGVQVAFIAAIIAMAYGIQVGLEGAPGSVAGLQITAQTMMQTVSGIVGGINTELRSLTNDLMGEASAFDAFKKEKMDLLEDAKNLLDTDSILSPFVVLGESPDDYYNRTIHSGNIGTYLIDDVHNFVSRNLQLPDFSSSIGGLKYDL